MKFPDLGWFAKMSLVTISFVPPNYCKCMLIEFSINLHTVHSVEVKFPSEFQENFLPFFSQECHDLSENLVVKNATKLFNSASCLNLGDFQWSDLTLVSLPNSFKHFALDPDELRLLFECYKALYPREEIELSSSVAHKFSNVLLGTEKLDCRNLRSARIMASWSGDDGLIDTSVPRKPGIVNIPNRPARSLHISCISIDLPFTCIAPRIPLNHSKLKHQNACTGPQSMKIGDNETTKRGSMAAGCVFVSPALYIVFLLLYMCLPRLNDSIHLRKQKGLKSSTFCTINHGFRGSVVTLLRNQVNFGHHLGFPVHRRKTFLTSSLAYYPNSDAGFRLL